MTIYFLLLAIIFLDGLVHILFRLFGKNEKGEIASFSYQLFCAFLYLPLIRGFPPVSFIWVFPLLAAFFYGVGGILLLKAYSIGEVSLLAPLSNLNPLLVFFFAVLFVGESVSVFKFLAIILIVFGLANLRRKENILLSLKAIITDKACRLYFLFVLSLSLARVVDKRGIEFFPKISYAFLQCLLPSMIALSYIKFKKETGEIGNFLRRKFTLLVPLGIIASLRYISFLKVISLTEVGLASAVISLNTLVALAMGRIFLKEKVASRWLAAVLMIAGAVILVLNI